MMPMWKKDTAPIIYDTKMGKDFCDSMYLTDVIGLSYDLLLRRGTMRINKIHVAFPDPQELREFAAKTAEKQKSMVTFPSEYNMKSSQVAVIKMWESVSLLKNITLHTKIRLPSETVIMMWR